MNTFSDTIRALEEIATTSTTSTAEPAYDFPLHVARGLERLPLLEARGNWHYRINEIEASLRRHSDVNAEMALLARVNALAISAAPEVVKVIDIDGEHGLLVKRYRIKEGEQLLRATSTRGRFQEEAYDRYRAELRRLHENGLYHPNTRGDDCMLIGEQSGSLFLEDWNTLHTIAPPGEPDVLLERIEHALEGKRTGDARFRRISRIEEVFGSRSDSPTKVLLPVIHPIGWNEALAAIRVAEEARVRGIFLINQGMGIEEVLRLVAEVRRRNPWLWIGVNFLGRTPAEAFNLARLHNINGVWTDDARIDETAATQPDAIDALAARRQWRTNGLYFGGVAFKYQRAVPDGRLGDAAVLASSYMDVVCTSGPGTGKAADVSKVAAMRAALGPSAALALASGITVDNVGAYLPYVDAFLVGTGLESRFGVLDPAKVAALRHAIEGRPR